MKKKKILRAKAKCTYYSRLKIKQNKIYMCESHLVVGVSFNK